MLLVSSTFSVKGGVPVHGNRALIRVFNAKCHYTLLPGWIAYLYGTNSSIGQQAERKKNEWKSYADAYGLVHLPVTRHATSRRIGANIFCRYGDGEIPADVALGGAAGNDAAGPPAQVEFAQY